ncbi:hypothetical protein KXW98_001509 [Aspergillus fumigatus]|uniref:Nucleoside-diphosphate-sugar epimerase, putative n=3 Tax=Aspergillus fumigatus TaxID=746128 RepID=Q4WBN9_ASPFU|nr:nucleoside-diphosphate-sugar epimerase, putative [Aspergillus fumigatus Af293]EDP48607.1 nucleoside-diphosphate-sugar epimerase, putative [Aspergillus fumigatus A1163]KAF4282349.1 hypothetical protein CNMCM8689_008325 [Aspergillus fumigatus]EAL85495.1 nucleoside-diphosphate-sugar epimerase, putative [Aspergillus fumigatus Af293]KAF4291976.1 hypothetical protein CNMCM8686_008001 [Aspergillus fumigatus]KAH1284571.1 hypothetical protein KXX48_001643 [Aspergillus fumigatus]
MTKVIIAGVTGFVGQEVLSQCLAHPSITSIVALCRRELPTTHPKLHVHGTQEGDFLSYSDPQLTASLRGAGSCIWTLGITPSRASDEQTLRRVTLEYTSQAAKAFNNAFTASNEAKQGGSAGSKFRFVYVSGGLAERDQSKPLWFSAGFRRVRGQAENILLEHEAAHSTTFESYILRPGLVLTRQGTFTDRIRGLVPSVRVDVLARRAIDIVVEGHSKRIWENAQINEWKGVHGRHT